ncbi:MAG: SpaA isopeptide-forming pilin-related protein [Eubacteriales bacterium]|nr:SpaA isopeptide-forming pilin-related protein [Eubacteriales bacterium]
MRKFYDRSRGVLLTLLVALICLTSIPIFETTVHAGPYENFEEGVKSAMIEGESKPIYAWRYDIVRVEDATGNVRPQENPNRYFYYEAGDKIYLSVTITPYIELPKFDIEYGRRGAKFTEVLWDLQPNEPQSVDLPEPVVVQARDIEYRGDKPIGTFQLSANFTPYESRADLNPPYFPISGGDLFKGHDVEQRKLPLPPEPDAPVIPKPNKTVQYTYPKDTTLAAEITVAIQKVTDANDVEIPAVDGRHVFLKAGDKIYPQYVIKNTGTKEINRLALVIRDEKKNDLFGKQDLDVALPVGQYKIYENLGPIVVTDAIINVPPAGSGQATSVPLKSYVFFEGEEYGDTEFAYAILYLNQGEVPLPPEEQGTTQWQEAAGLKVYRDGGCWDEPAETDMFNIKAGVTFQKADKNITGYLFYADELSPDASNYADLSPLKEAKAYGNSLLFIEPSRPELRAWKASGRDLALVFVERYMKDGQLVSLKPAGPIPVPSYDVDVPNITSADMEFQSNKNARDYWIDVTIKNLPSTWQTICVEYGTVDPDTGEFVVDEKLGSDYFTMEVDPLTGQYGAQQTGANSQFSSTPKEEQLPNTLVYTMGISGTTHEKEELRDRLHGKKARIHYVNHICDRNPGYIISDAEFDTKADPAPPRAQGFDVIKNPDDYPRAGGDAILKGVINNFSEGFTVSVQDEGRNTVRRVIFERDWDYPDEFKFKHRELISVPGEEFLQPSDTNTFSIVEVIPPADMNDPKVGGNVVLQYNDPKFMQKKWLVGYARGKYYHGDFLRAQEQTFSWWYPHVVIPANIVNLNESEKHFTVQRLHKDDDTADLYTVDPKTGEEALLLQATKNSDGTWTSSNPLFTVEAFDDHESYWDYIHNPQNEDPALRGLYKWTRHNLKVTPVGKEGSAQINDKHIKAVLNRAGDTAHTLQHEGSSDYVWSDATLMDKSYAEQFTPVGQEIKIGITESPMAQAGVANLQDLPPWTRVIFVDGAPDTSIHGTQDVNIRVIYPDKSHTDLTVPLTIRSQQENWPAKAKDSITVKQYDRANAGDALANRSQLPPVMVTFADGQQPDTKMPGTYPIKIKVSYKDGSFAILDSSMIVTPLDNPDLIDALERAKRNAVLSYCEDVVGDSDALDKLREAIRIAEDNSDSNTLSDEEKTHQLLAALSDWKAFWREANIARNPFPDKLTRDELMQTKEQYYFNLYVQRVGTNTQERLSARRFFNQTYILNPGDRLFVYLAINPNPSEHYLKNIHLGFRYGGYSHQLQDSGVGLKAKAFKPFKMENFTLNGQPWDLMNSMDAIDQYNSYYWDDPSGNSPKIGAAVTNEHGLLTCTQYIKLELPVYPELFPLYSNSTQFSISGGSENYGIDTDGAVKADAPHSIFFIINNSKMDFSYVLDKDYRLKKGDAYYGEHVSEIGTRSPIDPENPNLVLDYERDGSSFTPIVFDNELAPRAAFTSMWIEDNLLYDPTEQPYDYFNNYRDGISGPDSRGRYRVGEMKLGAFGELIRDIPGYFYVSTDTNHSSWATAPNPTDYHNPSFAMGYTPAGEYSNFQHFYLTYKPIPKALEIDKSLQPANQPLEGIIFDLYKSSSDGSEVKVKENLTTDANGQFKSLNGEVSEETIKKLVVGTRSGGYDGIGRLAGDGINADENGVYTLPDGQFLLEPGNYILKERAVDGLIPVEAISFTIEPAMKPEGSLSYTAEALTHKIEVANNPIPLPFEISKKDAISNTALPGAQFRLEAIEVDAGGQVVGSPIVLKEGLTIGADGSFKSYLQDTSEEAIAARIKNSEYAQVIANRLYDFGADGFLLVAGHYQLVETQAPQGYILDSTPRQFLLETAGTDPSTSKITIPNLQTPSPIRIKKINEAGQFVTGAIFKLEYLGTGADPVLLKSGIELTGEEYKSFTGDFSAALAAIAGGKEATNSVLYDFGEDGFLLLPGQYQLTETQAPENYILDEQAHKFTVNLLTSESTDIIIDAVNRQKAYPIYIDKTDGISGERLAGSVFKLEAISATGEAVLLKEGITLGDQMFKSFTGDITSAYQSIAAGKEKVANALYDFGDDGFLLVPGEYQLIETTAPAGYILNTSPQRFTMTSGDAAIETTISISNYKTPYPIEIEKLDESGLEHLAGAKFRLERVRSEAAPVILKENLEIGTEGFKSFTGNLEAALQAIAEGKELTEDCLYDFAGEGFLLLPGTYQLIETNPPVGYILDETPHSFELSVDTEETLSNSVSIVNRSKAYPVAIEKLGDDGETLIGGAVFRLEALPAGAAPVVLKDEITIAAERYISFTGDYNKALAEILAGKEKVSNTLYDFGAEGFLLLPGRYQLVELKAPEGYVLKEEPTVFEIGRDPENGLQLVQVSNALIPPPSTTTKETTDPSSPTSVSSEPSTKASQPRVPSAGEDWTAPTVFVSMLSIAALGLIVRKRRTN